MRRRLQEAKQLSLDHQQSQDLSQLLVVPGLSPDSGIRAPMGMGTEVAQSPGTCQGPRVMLMEVQENSPASSSSGSGAKYSQLPCRTQRPHGSSPLGLRLDQAMAGSLCMQGLGPGPQDHPAGRHSDPLNSHEPQWEPQHRGYGEWNWHYSDLGSKPSSASHQLAIWMKELYPPVCLSLPIGTQGGRHSPSLRAGVRTN